MHLSFATDIVVRQLKKILYQSRLTKHVNHSDIYDHGPKPVHEMNYHFEFRPKLSYSFRQIGLLHGDRVSNSIGNYPFLYLFDLKRFNKFEK